MVASPKEYLTFKKDMDHIQMMDLARQTGGLYQKYSPSQVEKCEEVYLIWKQRSTRFMMKFCQDEWGRPCEARVDWASVDN